MTIDTAKLRKDAQAKLDAAKIIHDKAEVVFNRAEEIFEEAEEEFDQVMQGIDSIERLAALQDGNPQTKPREDAPRKRFWTGLRDAIRLVLKEKPAGITLRDVEDFIEKTYPGRPKIKRQNISSALSKMGALGELRIVQPGSGATPARFALKAKEGSETK